MIDRFRTKIRIFKIKEQHFKVLRRYEEEEEAHKITKKCLKEKDASKTKTRRVGELTIETIENNSSKSLNNLKIEKLLLTEKILCIERKLEELEISTEIINTIKRVIFESVTLKLYDIYDLELELE